jgi:hypothetical protein
MLMSAVAHHTAAYTCVWGTIRGAATWQFCVMEGVIPPDEVATVRESVLAASRANSSSPQVLAEQVRIL